MSINVKDLASFQRFLQLCAGRIGQLVNLSSLASDTGISRAAAYIACTENRVARALRTGAGT
jgi:hypothetical protein